MSKMLEWAKRIAERAGKNAKVAPELLYAPILGELQDDARRSADSAHAKIANWLEDQARIATNGLHCGDNSTVIKHTYDWADKLEAAARHLRAEPRASAVSAQPEVWMWRATVGGVWGSWRLLDQPIDEFKKSAWGFNLGNGTAEVRALYARPERTEPQSASVVHDDLIALNGDLADQLAGMQDAAETLLAQYDLGAGHCLGVMSDGKVCFKGSFLEKLEALKTALAHCQAGIEQRHMAQLLTVLDVMKSAHSKEPDRLMSIWSRDIEAVEAAVAALTRPKCEGK